MNDIWSISYSNNDANTVEMAGFELSDGTFVMLPWQGNTGTTCSFKDGGTYFDDHTGVFSYRFIVKNGKPFLHRITNFSGTGAAPDVDMEITSYVHTHPYTDGRYSVMDPTPAIGNPNQPGYQEYGDWEFSRLYGVPGKLITQNHVIEFYYDPNSSNHRAMGTTWTKSQKCPTSHPD